MNYRSERVWQNYLRQEYRLPNNQPIQTHKWVEHLVRDGILPLLKQKQYNLICKPQELASCILNHLIRHERDYKKCKFTTYRCMHREEVSIEEYEFYEEQISESIWNWLKHEFTVDWFADVGPFAERIWRNLPLIVFEHLSMDSPVNQILYEKMRCLEDDEEDELLGPGMGFERE
jgi:hypothetical protein